MEYQTTSGGVIHHPLGTALDETTAINVDARLREAGRVPEDIGTRLTALETVAGMASGDTSDAAVASAVAGGALTQAALDARFGGPSALDVLPSLVTSQVARTLRYADIAEPTGAGWRPAMTNTSRLVVWGSSSAKMMVDWGLSARAAQMGVTVVNAAQGGEASEHIAARLGSVPARVLMPDDTIPASGSVVIESPTMRPEKYLRGYFGWLCGVYGSITSDGAVLRFNRATAGDPVPCPPGSTFTPVTGSREASSMTILWMGKNDPPGEEAQTVARVDASALYASGMNKRVLVIGHFVSEGVDQDQVDKVHRLNAEHKAMYGDLYLDCQDWLMSSQVWEDTGVAPTDKDRQAQAAGYLPPSLQYDRHHMNQVTQQAMAKRVHEKLAALGWVSLSTATIYDDFGRADNASMGATPVGGKTWYTVTGGGTNGQAGNFEIKGGRAVVETMNDTTWAAQIVHCPSADGVVEATVFDANCGLWVRAKDGQGISIMWSAAQKKWRALTYPSNITELDSDASSTPLTPGDRLRVEMSGQTVTVKVNGMQIMQFTDSTMTTNTQHGMVGLSVGSRIDDWSYTA